MKYKVTNTTQLSEGGARNVFITEAGKLIKPGETCVCNRLDGGTKRLADAKALQIDEGAFEPPPVFKKEPVKPPEPPTASTKESQDRAAADARNMDARMAAAAAEPKPEPDGEPAPLDEPPASEGKDKKKKSKDKKSKDKG